MSHEPGWGCEMAQVRAEHVNPFLESVDQLFANMLGCDARRGPLGTSRGAPARYEITALIGLSGPTRGTIALSFPAGTAAAMVGRLMGATLDEADEAIVDGVSELVNMVAGGAKARLSSNAGGVIDLSLPTVIRGRDFQFQGPSHAVWLDIPFESELGEFCVRVTFQD